MSAAENTPETDAGRQAAADKAAAADRIRAQAAADQAEAEAAERKRQQTAAARAARSAKRPAEEPGPVIDQAEETAAESGCEGCRQFQEITFERLGRLETQVNAIGKLVFTGVIAGAVIWYLSRGRAAVAELAAAEPAAAGTE